MTMSGACTAGNFPKSVCTSVNECICHGIPDSRPLVNGDIINIDVTVYLNVRAKPKLPHIPQTLAMYARSSVSLLDMLPPDATEQGKKRVHSICLFLSLHLFHVFLAPTPVFDVHNPFGLKGGGTPAGLPRRYLAHVLCGARQRQGAAAV